MSSLSYFPYQPREDQEEFMAFVQEAVEENNLCIDAPTGYGKTPCILAGILPHVRKRGQKVIWAVRTGNQTDRPIEEVREINRRKGRSLTGISYRGKKDMCLLARDQEEELSYEDVAYLCRAKRKSCPYSGDISPRLVGSLRGRASLYSEILELSKGEGICPYELQREMLPLADVVALNYNYIIHQGISWSIKSLAPFSKALLVVDEAHNLHKAVQGLNSVKITLGTLERGLREIGGFRVARAEEARVFLLDMREKFSFFLEKMESSGREDMEFPAESFLSRLSESHDLKACVASVKRYGQAVRRKQLKKGKRPRSSLRRLGIFLEALMDTLDIEGVAQVATRRGKNLEVEVWDMRSEEVLAKRWEEFHRCSFCSGTLKPLKAFAETVGLGSYRGRRFSSAFSLENIRTLVTRELTTEGESLGEEMRERYLRSIERFIEGNRANLAVFSASYRIQSALLPGVEEIAVEQDRELFVESQGMSGDLGRELLEGFKASARGGKRGLLLATMQGRFAEGADFPGRELEGIFLVGVPFDRMNTRTRLYLSYYRGLYGMKKGEFYAYVIPALRRASQALGRCLRSKQDRAVFVLGDRRYAWKRFHWILPDYVKETVSSGTSEDIPSLRP